MFFEIPLFPLNIVAYPGEYVNLHIFEPRYKDLVNDCLQEERRFGIPTYLGETIKHGTEVELIKVEKLYPDGRMDIRTRGTRIFEVLEFSQEWKGNSYAGGRVKFLDNKLDSKGDHVKTMLHMAEKLFSWLNMNEKFKYDKEYLSYSIAHKVGLKLEEELELLTILNEDERQGYIISHLEKLLPALERAASARERIALNGHFKHLTPPSF